MIGVHIKNSFLLRSISDESAFVIIYLHGDNGQKKNRIYFPNLIGWVHLVQLFVGVDVIVNMEKLSIALYNKKYQFTHIDLRNQIVEMMSNM
jgi:hypothetical protein